MKSFQIFLPLLAALLLSLPATDVALAALRAPQAKKETAKAVPLFPDAAREEPKQKASARAGKKLQKIYDLSQDEKYDQAIELANEVIADPKANAYDKAIAYQSLGYSYIDKDDYPHAIEALNKAVEQNALPNDTHFQMMYQVAQLQLSEEQYDAALKSIDRFLTESKSDKPEHLVLKGNALYRLERYQEAVDALKAAIAKTDKPEDSWLQILMACYFEMEKPIEAAGIAEQILQRNPDDKSLIRNLSSIYLQAEQNDKAAQILEDAKNRGLLTEERDYEQLYKLYHYIEKEPKAIATIEEGLKKGILKPSATLYRTLAEAYYFSEPSQTGPAIDAYKKAADLAQDGEAGIQLARLLNEEQRFAEAKTAVQQALSKGVKQPGTAYLMLGTIEFGLNNKAGAIAAYKQATKYPESKNMAETWLRQSGIK